MQGAKFWLGAPPPAVKTALTPALRVTPGEIPTSAWWNWLIAPPPGFTAGEMLGEPKPTTFWTEIGNRDVVEALHVAALIAKRRGFDIGPVRYWRSEIAFIDQDSLAHGDTEDFVTIAAHLATGNLFVTRKHDFPLIVAEQRAKRRS